MNTLDQIQGQDPVIAELKHRLDKQTLHGSFLFTGPDGVGKKSAALALVATLLGHEKFEEKLYTHPDIYFLEPDDKDTIKIEAARGLIRRMSFKPTQAPCNIAIIDRCDRMTTEASNALLKTIEEPSGSIFLITSRPGSLLPTIRSRCQDIRFKPLSTQIVVSLLQQLEDWSQAECEAAAALADGSLSQASHFGNWLQELGLDLQELFRALSSQPYTELESRLKELPSDPQGVLCLLAGLRHICRNQLITTSADDPDPWLQCIDAIGVAESALRQHTAPLLLWETLAFSFQRVLRTRDVA